MSKAQQKPHGCKSGCSCFGRHLEYEYFSVHTQKVHSTSKLQYNAIKKFEYTFLDPFSTSLQTFRHEILIELLEITNFARACCAERSLTESRLHEPTNCL